MLRSFADERYQKLDPDIIKNHEEFLRFEADVAKARHLSIHQLIP